ncbi:prespore-specific regulator [Cytobacillus oceanisediminis]|jgi:prespore-specific regulator|uniref:Prespore-specific regulator n=1 Tax=Cytobacillus oceanisediminis TaxID=665099 RepID=A0A2V2ZS20_9BACI|nr:hypothetical protein [Cytobacillus oceanisediminis]PWW26460.1 prespore-specific regulator [Cytobacillus oceanisediminis]
MKERKDLWKPEEDKFLKETVLEYTSNGDSKASAFKKASSELGRTVSACQYRWNAVLKRESSLPAAEVDSSGNTVKQSSNDFKTAPLTSLDQVIRFLKNFAKTQPDSELLKQNKLLNEEHAQLKLLNEQLKINLDDKRKAFEKELLQYEEMTGILKEADHLLKQEGIEDKRAVH